MQTGRVTLWGVSPMSGFRNPTRHESGAAVESAAGQKF